MPKDNFRSWLKSRSTLQNEPAYMWRLNKMEKSFKNWHTSGKCGGGKKKAVNNQTINRLLLFSTKSEWFCLGIVYGIWSKIHPQCTYCKSAHKENLISNLIVDIVSSLKIRRVCECVT